MHPAYARVHSALALIGERTGAAVPAVDQGPSSTLSASYHARAATLRIAPGFVQRLASADLELILAHEVGHHVDRRRVLLTHRVLRMSLVAALTWAIICAACTSALFVLSLPVLAWLYWAFPWVRRRHEHFADRFAAQMAGCPETYIETVERAIAAMGAGFKADSKLWEQRKRMLRRAWARSKRSR